MTSTGGVQVASKHDIRKRLGRSPDVGDAVVQVFTVRSPSSAVDPDYRAIPWSDGPPAPDSGVVPWARDPKDPPGPGSATLRGGTHRLGARPGAGLATPSW